jgi:hypothetical protein
MVSDGYASSGSGDHFSRANRKACFVIYRGGCKCGAAAFEAKGEIDKAMECNCSICRPKGYLHWFVPVGDFRLDRGEDALGSFQFNKRVLTHRFCRTCGVSPFVQGDSMAAVNLRCVEGVDLKTLTIEPFDGAKL